MMTFIIYHLSGLIFNDANFKLILLFITLNESLFLILSEKK